jgi:hypothetical protein
VAQLGLVDPARLPGLCGAVARLDGHYRRLILRLAALHRGPAVCHHLPAGDPGDSQGDGELAAIRRSYRVDFRCPSGHVNEIIPELILESGTASVGKLLE